MNAYRNGEAIVVCDGCHKRIANYSPKVHRLSKKTAPWGGAAHACSTRCVKKIKANPPNEQRCKECNVRVATGALVCMNNHPTELVGRVKGIAVSTTTTKETH